jgi:hypothetical protein
MVSGIQALSNALHQTGGPANPICTLGYQTGLNLISRHHKSFVFHCRSPLNDERTARLRQFTSSYLFAFGVQITGYNDRGLPGLQTAQGLIQPFQTELFHPDLRLDFNELLTAANATV